MNILRALPPVEGDAFSSSKSLHYLLIHDIVTNRPEAWETMNKDHIFQIIDRCNEMHKCRDLNAKLRGCLTKIKTSTFSMDDYFQLF